jgi:hypothetical protein
MTYLVVAIIVVGLGLLAANLLTQRSLWLSDQFERPQKIAQTILLWAVPGSFILVRHIIHERPIRPHDTTSHPYDAYTDASAVFYDHSGGGGHGGGGDPA